MSLTKGKTKAPKQVALEIDLKKAQQAIIDDMGKREQAALAEFNEFVEAWSKKHGVTLSLSQPQLQVKANP